MAQPRAALLHVLAKAKYAGSACAAPVFERPEDRGRSLPLNLRSTSLRLGLGNLETVGGLRATFALNLPQHTPLVRVLLIRLHTFFRQMQADGLLACVRRLSPSAS